MSSEGLFFGSVGQGLVSCRAGTLSVKVQEGPFPEEEGVGREMQGGGEEFITSTRPRALAS